MTRPTAHFLQPAGLLLLAASIALCQDVPESEVIRVGPGVTLPKPTYRPEPTFTDAARDAGVQGNVSFEIVITTKGTVSNISLLSPLGFGLDERAQAAISTWRFEPGRKGGTPVNILAVVEVSFRFANIAFDNRAEERRTNFNVAVHNLKGPAGPPREKAIKTLLGLAKQNYAPALFVYGKLQQTGEVVPRDADAGAVLIRKAAEKDFGPAMYYAGREYLDGQNAPKDEDKGLKLIRDASVLGSPEAQYFLGDRYQRGIGVLVDTERSRRYFRLCAANGEIQCQLRLGKLLLGLTNRQEREYIQAIAWLQVAADGGQTEAGEISRTEAARLTPEQLAWVQRLKIQLVHKQ